MKEKIKYYFFKLGESEDGVYNCNSREFYTPYVTAIYPSNDENKYCLPHEEYKMVTYFWNIDDEDCPYDEDECRVEIEQDLRYGWIEEHKEITKSDFETLSKYIYVAKID